MGTNDSEISSAAGTVGRIMVVDDDPIVAGMLGVTLSTAGHEVIEMHAGADALAYVADADKPLPDIVIVDIEMPGMDGYEACRQLKSGETSGDIPVIFLSGHDTLDDRLQAFDAGGDDFMSKPFAPEEVLRKAAVAIRHSRQRIHQTRERQAAFGAAMTAMTSLGETGATLKFSSQALKCRSYGALAESVIEAMGSYELECHVQLRGPGVCLTRTPRGAASPLEESVFEKVMDMGRIFSFKNRMVVNYDTVSVLVVNMPVENEDFCGRIRDHAAMIAEAGEHAMDNITMRNEAFARARELQEMAGMTAEVVETLRQNYRQMQMSSRIELEGMVTRIESMYHGLALSTSQEDMISDAVRGASDHVVALLEQGIELDQRFEAIVERLSQSASLPVEAPEAVESEIELW